MEYLHWIHIWSIHYRPPPEHFCEELSDSTAASWYKCRPAENMIVWSSRGSVWLLILAWWWLCRPGPRVPAGQAGPALLRLQRCKHTL